MKLTPYVILILKTLKNIHKTVNTMKNLFLLLIILMFFSCKNSKKSYDLNLGPINKFHVEYFDGGLKLKYISNSTPEDKNDCEIWHVRNGEYYDQIGNLIMSVLKDTTIEANELYPYRTQILKKNKDEYVTYIFRANQDSRIDYYGQLIFALYYDRNYPIKKISRDYIYDFDE